MFVTLNNMKLKKNCISVVGTVISHEVSNIRLALDLLTVLDTRVLSLGQEFSI